jgi:flavin-dependent dehydrogenase
MNELFDIGIVGGGLGGLTLAIQAAQQGFKVVLFEKEQYPFHKVCGEYISFESWDFLERCGIPLSKWDLPSINQLSISTIQGKSHNYDLPLGGFGISRYKLDNALYEIALELGVIIHTRTKVSDVQFSDDCFVIESDRLITKAKLVVGSFGKRSNLDVKWKRSFIQQKPSKINHFIGVKYHIKYDHPLDQIALHNFPGGYCGISAIEDGNCCLCYLTRSSNLAAAGNSIKQMEKDILATNPHLAHIFLNAEFLYDQPLTISQISFDKKEQVQHHMLYVGDAAGLITPLCGNGMSMAMHAGKLALAQMSRFLNGDIDRSTMELNYVKTWKKHFAFRTATGRIVQQFFGGNSTDLFLSLMSQSNYFSRRLIQETHGQPF